MESQIGIKFFFIIITVNHVITEKARFFSWLSLGCSQSLLLFFFPLENSSLCINVANKSTMRGNWKEKRKKKKSELNSF